MTGVRACPSVLVAVAVATLGVSLALVIRIFGQYSSLDEDDILVKTETTELEGGHAHQR